jgi:hypothetical protein
MKTGAKWDPMLASRTRMSRVRRTLRLFKDKARSLMEIEVEIRNECDKHPIMLRCNGGSDLPWLTIEIAKRCKDLIRSGQLRLLEYTKIYKAAKMYRENGVDVCLSYDGSNWSKYGKFLEEGGIVGVVFKEIPDQFRGWPVMNGDNHDAFYSHGDNGGYVVGLKLKGGIDSIVTKV